MIFLTVPDEYKKPYLFLLEKMADVGVDLLKDCNKSCDTSTGRVIKCWNMFNAACAAYGINIKLAKLLFTYIEAQLNSDYVDEYANFVYEEQSNKAFNKSFNKSFE